MNNKSVFVLGDSISIHYGPYLSELFKNNFDYSRKGDIEIDPDNPTHLGDDRNNGGDSRLVLEYLTGLFKSRGFDYNYLLLNCGLHDIKQKHGNCQIPLPDYDKNLQNIIKLVTCFSGTQIIWINSTPVDDEIHKKNTDIVRVNRDVIKYNKAACQIMSENGIPEIDLYGFTLNLPEDLYCDHVHFTHPVRKKQAEFIYYKFMEIALLG
ncbi:MAG: SGNH/GDSL hydrolase family protein [bacterium]